MAGFDLRLAGGDVLLPGVGLCEVDLLVRDGKVAGLCQTGHEVSAAEVVPVGGLTILPGAIDPHVHLGQDICAPRTSRDIAMESDAAASGGVTMFLAFLVNAGSYDELFREAVELGEGNSSVDFGFHFCINSREQLQDVHHYVNDLGVSSFKFFMNFRGDEGRYLGIPGSDDAFLYQLLESVRDAEALLCPHTENIELVWHLRDRVRGLEAGPLQLWNETRPPFVEAEAMQRVGYLARTVGAPIYAVHVSSTEALDIAMQQRSHHARTYIETCPHYLTHDYNSSVGELGKVNPPLRSDRDCGVLWEALKAGDIDAVGSDHNARAKEKKSGGIWNAAAGFPGLETLLPILISEGHCKRGLTLQRIAEVTSSNAARIFGLYPRKGAIAVGSDADFAIVDLDGKHTIRAEDLHSEAGYSIYDGWEVSCRIVHTVVRGTFVMRDGAVQDTSGHGKYYPRFRSGR